MAKVRWGILGAGRIARKFASDSAFAPSAIVQAVGARDHDRARAFAHAFNIPTAHRTYEDLLSDPDVDAIYIATPHNFHLEQSLACLKAGKHVLCEKPLTVSVEECKTLITAADQSELYVMEAMWTWFLPAVQQAKAWLEDGRIGELVQVRADFGFKAKFNPDDRLWNPDLAGGALLDIGIYPVAFHRFMLGRGPDSVTAHGRLASTGVDEEINAIFQTRDVTSLLTCSFRTQLANIGYLYGTKGRIEIPNFWRAVSARLFEGSDLVDQFNDHRQGDGFEFEIEAASQDILAGRSQSSVMPLSASLILQEDMGLIRSALV